VRISDPEFGYRLHKYHCKIVKVEVGCFDKGWKDMRIQRKRERKEEKQWEEKRRMEREIQRVKNGEGWRIEK